MFLMRKIARVVDDTDDRFQGRQATGGIDFIGRVLSGPQTGFMLVDRWKCTVQRKKDLVKMWFAELLIAMKAGIRIDADQICSFKLSDMVCKCTICDVQLFGKLIHAHFSVLQEQSQNFNADIGTKSLENLKALRKSFDISHKTSLRSGILV